MLGPEDIGHRVVVRRVVGEREDRTLFSDALGELVEIDGSQLTVRTSTGRVRIPRALVARAKRVPEPRHRTHREIAELELAANDAWPAPETERLGDWLLRAAGGFTGRANTALPIGDPGRPLPAALDGVRRWYAERGLPARMNLPLPLASAVGRALDERGWAPAAFRVLVQAVPIEALLAGERPGVALDPVPAPDVLALVTSHRGELPPAAWQILTGPPLVRFATVRDGQAGAGPGELLAVARGAVTRQRLHLGLIEVVPAARRRGLAQRVIRALAGWAADHGARSAYLQVAEPNEPAVALYAKLGFATHHTYVTRTAPGL